MGTIGMLATIMIFVMIFVVLNRTCRPLTMHTLRYIRAVLCTVLALGLTACQKKGDTPDWDTSGNKQPLSGQSAAKSSPAHSKKSNPKTSSENQVSTPIESDPGNLRFITYNVENWLTMDRYVDNKLVNKRPKPDQEKNAVIHILAAQSPDVIGLCEIGEVTDLAEIQESLKAAGLDLPHSHYTGGSDPVRHIGLLSRFPIVSTAKPAESEYQLNGQTLGINRGILDVTIRVRGKSYRFVGVHLKSKREVEQRDQEEMRINEAHLLRRHLDSIFQSDPKARLIVYGDFNDTYPSKAVRSITSSPDALQRMIPIYFKDSHGEAWTHYWKNQDIYSRIDYVTVSITIKPEVNFRACHIIDDPQWDQASDHRPLLAIFR